MAASQLNPLGMSGSVVRQHQWRRLEVVNWSGGLNSKLHAVCGGLARPIIMLLTEGRMSERNGAFLMLSALPRARALLARREGVSRPAVLRLEAGGEFADHAVTVHDAGDRTVGLPPFADCGDEFAVLKLDAVHRDIDL